ncbi:ABC transporter ATP-binding protein [Basfia succiniciproducens]|uniref:FepC protein n=1 Tax=Mannheimia succiniciproducens (strain KCTC 0769BP / MBEL55E) TaxID=221988 RepID=Q65TA2_MANSM|nr:ATP-binding cassette domain-containing protein [[Mannheimia] succiniciproducens]AAU37808.1 FepC protein [[Mannheimia] succiniciproducens MBEL55E]
MFQLEQASFAIPNRALLAPTTLTFRRGKVYGLIGHNGSGKSTLIKLMAKQNPLSSGEIFVRGKALRHWGSREFAREVAYLPQHLPTATQLTARELIQMGRYAWNGLLKSNKEKDKSAVENALILTHTEKFAEQQIDVLSGGERQRIWLAMLLAQQSNFLLLDEPLAALDIAHQVEVMKLIKKLSRELNLGVVIVIHDVNLAAAFCDELVALHSGKLLVKGTPGQIMTTETLQRIYGLELNVIPHPQTQVPVVFY